MIPLAQQSARPRSGAHRPTYPSTVGVGLLLAATSCAQATTLSPQTPPTSALPDDVPVSVVLVGSSPPVQAGRVVVDNGPAPSPPPADLLAGAPLPTFPEDDLDAVMGVGCGGGCPPAYVLETQSRDQGQLEARVKYCGERARRHVPQMTGTVKVEAQIDTRGRANKVDVELTGDIPSILIPCVERLVQGAQFAFKYNYARQSSHNEEFKLEAEP